MCMEVDNSIVTIHSRIRSEGDALSPILFNVAVEKVARELERTEDGD